MTAPSATSGAWTCPFCPLACDHLGVSSAADGGLMLQGSNCERAARGLAACATASAVPSIDAQPASLDAAFAAAAARLGASRQPLFAGLGTDVAGARALYPLSCATGAIVDSAGSDALMHGLRALQDRGQFTTTLAEVRTRADLIVFVGGLPTSVAPLIGERLGIGPNVSGRLVAQRHVVVIGPEGDDKAALAAWSASGVTTEAVALHGDLFDTVSLLDALVARRPAVANAAVPGALRALADRLRSASYGVLVGAPPRLPAQGALVIEAVHRIVGELNRKTRAAALWIGGGNGAATANQVFTWLSGVPMRSRAGPRGLEHEPLRYGSTRLLAQGAVDALLWVASFDAESAPPDTALPTIVLGHPALALRCNKPGTVFIPVTTPGIGSAGHVFRTDGTVLMPLHAVRSDGMPTVADVAKRLLQALPQRSAA